VIYVILVIDVIGLIKITLITKITVQKLSCDGFVVVCYYKTFPNQSPVFCTNQGANYENAK